MAIASIGTRTDGHLTITRRVAAGDLSVIAMISTVAQTEMIALATAAIEWLWPATADSP
jgi:hypothetical protein